MLKRVVGCSRVLKHVVTGSRANVMLAFCPASSLVTCDQFINTKSFRLYSTDADGPRKRYAYYALEHLVGPKISRSLMRGLKRIVPRLSSNVQVVRPVSKKEDADCIYFIIPLSRVKPEGLKVSVDHGTVFIEGKDTESLEKICGVDLPDIDLQDKIYNTSDIKAEFTPHCGTLKLIIPKLKQEETVYDVNFKIIESTF
ncbi:heat shock 22 kDa protein, mitochondrial-like [Rutidosis leptorrhynchoides]|uniref:heat shock 22 kDa protein, mitochondrial-like n=1 Tax=Rutidosis leptorrhynchoides TaxID=125765 RepID=UPI003A99ACA8